MVPTMAASVSGATIPSVFCGAAAVPGTARDLRKGRLGTLVLGAIGVVYGDLGTSPLYTVRECFRGLPVNTADVLGLLSVIFWSLMVVVTGKYVLFVMRADNHGEGGILALLALARRAADGRPRRRGLLILAGLSGAALFYGDGMITPAISVLSAIEGLDVATPAFKPFVLPLTLAVLVALFFVQRHGTEEIGRLFGPVMLLWFLVLGGLGLVAILHHPNVLAALDPSWALGFFLRRGSASFLTLGAVVLALTGAEALYADMGHFGARPIKLAWFALVLPALVLNYFGQGALLLADPAAVDNPFFHLVPAWGLYPLVVLSAAATVIASQAVISGAFSLTHQAIQLGFCPRLSIRHTSVSEIGQIYIPQLNWGLLLAVLGLVLGFRSSSNLAAAYGIAVTGTMATTTLLAYVVARHAWGWPRRVAVPLALLFITVDLSFFGANLLKVVEGGWFPLAIGAAFLLLMTTWKRGREALLDSLSQPDGSLEQFIGRLDPASLQRVGGTAVFLTASRHGVPYALVHNLRHNEVLHERVAVMTVITEDVPFVPASHRILIKALPLNIYRVWCRYGFMEQPDLPNLLETLRQEGLAPLDLKRTSFFLGREILVAGDHPSLPLWQMRLFAFMARNAASAADFFNLPPDRVIELGAQVRL